MAQVGNLCTPHPKGPEASPRGVYAKPRRFRVSLVASSRFERSHGPHPSFRRNFLGHPLDYNLI